MILIVLIELDDDMIMSLTMGNVNKYRFSLVKNCFQDKCWLMCQKKKKEHSNMFLTIKFSNTHFPEEWKKDILILKDHLILLPGIL